MPRLRGPGAAVLASIRRLLLVVASRTSPLVGALGLLGALGLGLVGAEPFLPSPYAPVINVRWNSDVGVEERQALESEFRLVRPEYREGTTWQYDLVDAGRDNVAALVADPAADDTQGIDRALGVVEPDASRGTTWIGSWPLNFWRVSPVLGILASLSAAAFLFAAVSVSLPGWQRSGRTRVLTTLGLVAVGYAWHVIFRSQAPSIVALLAAAGTAISGALGRTYRMPAAGMAVTAVALLGALALIGQASPVRMMAAGGLVFVFGYVTGALLVPPRDADAGLSLLVVRTIVGLLLTVVGYFLCLRFSMPWLIGPAALLLLAVLRHGRTALHVPGVVVAPRWDTILAGMAAVIVVSPILVTAILMSPGDYPPLFFHTDTPFFLGHVHSLVTATTFPPPSLNVLGVRLPNHYATQGIAAVIARASGLAPHHAYFLVLLPLLVAGVVAAAVALIRCIGAQLPWLVALPLLLNPVPTLWYRFSRVVGPKVMEAMTGLTLVPVRELLGEHQVWGVSNINPHNVATPFLIFACLYGILRAPSRGWRLPVFIAGIAFIVKAPTGVSLLAGLGLVQLVRAVAERRLRPLLPVAAATVVFAAAYALFWFVPGNSAATGLGLYPLYQLRSIADDDWGLVSFGADILWVLIPALLVLGRGARADGRVNLELLAFACAPFIVANTLRATSTNTTTDNWLQLMISVPLMLRALVLGIAGQRWGGLGARLRTVFAGTAALVIVPGLVAAAYYSTSIVRNPANGHEFSDNRAIAEALATIPTAGSLVVTNDLRSPARGSGAGDHQDQIPALFGHQAFAVDYLYERYPFSDERLALQELLRSERWTDAIGQAAREYGWTHFLVHKSYIHPAVIPLEQLFENDDYVVYRFPTAAGEP